MEPDDWPPLAVCDAGGGTVDDSPRYGRGFTFLSPTGRKIGESAYLERYFSVFTPPKMDSWSTLRVRRFRGSSASANIIPQLGDHNTLMLALGIVRAIQY